MALKGTDVPASGPASIMLRYTPGSVLYRVTCNSGATKLSVRTAAAADASVCGVRQVGDYVQGAGVEGDWVRLRDSEAEDSGDYTIGEGDRVVVTCGVYEGKRGDVVDDLNDDGEYGVELDGYRGTGHFEPRELLPERPMEDPRGEYYDLDTTNLWASLADDPPNRNRK